MNFPTVDAERASLIQVATLLVSQTFVNYPLWFSWRFNFILSRIVLNVSHVTG